MASSRGKRVKISSCTSPRSRVDGYKTLNQGQAVEFEIAQSDKGLQASKVVPVG